MDLFVSYVYHFPILLKHLCKELISHTKALTTFQTFNKIFQNILWENCTLGKASRLNDHQERYATGWRNPVSTTSPSMSEAGWSRLNPLIQSMVPAPLGSSTRRGHTSPSFYPFCQPAFGTMPGGSHDQYTIISFF